MQSDTAAHRMKTFEHRGEQQRQRINKKTGKEQISINNRTSIKVNLVRDKHISVEVKAKELIVDWWMLHAIPNGTQKM